MLGKRLQFFLEKKKEREEKNAYNFKIKKGKTFKMVLKILKAMDFFFQKKKKLV